MGWSVKDRCTSVAPTTGREDCVFKKWQNGTVKGKP